MARNKLRPLYPTKRKPVDQAEQGTPINIPAEFLAEHGRVCMENSQLRQALERAQQAVAFLTAKLRDDEGEATEPVSRKPVLVREPAEA